MQIVLATYNFSVLRGNSHGGCLEIEDALLNLSTRGLYPDELHVAPQTYSALQSLFIMQLHRSTYDRVAARVSENLHVGYRNGFDGKILRVCPIQDVPLFELWFTSEDHELSDEYSRNVWHLQPSWKLEPPEEPRLLLNGKRRIKL